ncbi:TOBE domain-containing protein [Halomarina oriensis]|uniref:Uncharacterized protein n=1 Tax=Halomarina oriensis TaxID=671145 RepID=A0A6B0GST4_9EURY|nr:hypothetical protein [Halomarina oriensis]MWG36377.1 hypothetical protein [Halomarina oriensis]
MAHDRIHAREPDHHVDRWTPGTVEEIEERDGHAVVTVSAPDGESVELTVTLAVRDLFVGRLGLEPGESPAGERVWFRKHGGR